MDTRVALIGLDWGSTQLRAYLFDRDGTVLERRALPHGLQQLPLGGFAEAFAEAVTGWPVLPVLACGMVGSRNGWREVPYLDTPVSVDRLAGSLLMMNTPDDYRMYLVPGLRDPSRPDVMRGEETQVVGVLCQSPTLAQRGYVLLPGTHSKWVRLGAGEVLGFATAMTGELYGLLREHSVLGAQLPAAVRDDTAFMRGVRTARECAAAGVLSRIFSARTLMLDGKLPASSVPDYLSGLLIGEELRMALAAGWFDPAAEVQLVGERVLCERYLEAAQWFDLYFRMAAVTSTAAGLWHIASMAGLMASEVST